MIITTLKPIAIRENIYTKAVSAIFEPLTYYQIEFVE